MPKFKYIACYLAVFLIGLPILGFKAQAQNQSGQVVKTSPWNTTGLPCHAVIDCGNRINTLPDGSIIILNTTHNQLYYLYPDGSPPEWYDLSEFTDVIVDFKPLDSHEIVLMTISRASGDYELVKLMLPEQRFLPLNISVEGKLISCDSTPFGSNEIFHGINRNKLLVCSYTSPNIYNIHVADVTSGTIVSTPFTLTGGGSESFKHPWLFLTVGNQDDFFILFSDLDRTPPPLSLLQQFVPTITELSPNQIPILHYSISQETYDLRLVAKSAFSRIPDGRGALVFEVMGAGIDSALYLITRWFDEQGNHIDILKFAGDGEPIWRLTEVELPTAPVIIKFITDNKILVTTATDLILMTWTSGLEPPS